MNPIPTNHNLLQALRFLQFLGFLLAGLDVLPIASAALPMPPSWRPYQLGVACFLAAAKTLVECILAAWAKLKDTPPP